MVTPLKTLVPSWRTLLSVPRSHSCERLFPPALCSQECEHGTHECVRNKASSSPLAGRRSMVTPLKTSELAGEIACPTSFVQVGQALSPANRFFIQRLHHLCTP